MKLTCYFCAGQRQWTKTTIKNLALQHWKEKYMAPTFHQNDEYDRSLDRASNELL